MLRPKMILAVLLLFAVTAIVVTPLLGQGGEAKNLEERVVALEERIATLERTMAQRLASLERRVEAGAAGPVDDPAAEAAYAEISRLMASGEYEKAKTEMASFMKQYGETNTAKKARRTYQELSVIGKASPETWDIEKWFQGENQVDLNKGTTLLVFWEEWCPHCKREVPKLQSWYTDLKGQGLQIIGLTKLTRSSTEEKVTSFIADNHVDYPMAKETGELSRYFNVSGIPAAAVIKDGKVVWRGHPAQLNEAQLKSWL
ncbi:MAG TPA: redoxin domain-containing protein [Candidatus Polarisedimenticolaceae bacterium]|nr:redoxin domain-containing protein [Candidatus Polarisedimenticolaceae bacterium]